MTDFDLQWLLLALPLAFAMGWLASRLDRRQRRHELEASPRAYFKGLNLLLNEQQDKAIDAFIEAVQHDPGSSDLHFALGNLFRRRGEYERAVRVHQHLLARADLPADDRDRAQHALAQDFLKAGLFDRAEAAFQALAGTRFDTEARLALLTLHERSRDWKAAIEVARGLEAVAAGSFAQRIAHYHCELTLEADARGDRSAAEAALQRAREVAPQSARPLILAGQRLARAGQHAEAVALWAALSTVHPELFAVVAGDYTTSAQACGQADEARSRLRALHASQPSTDLLAALLRLETDPGERRRLLLQQLQTQQSLSAGLQLLQDWQDAATTPTGPPTGQAAEPASTDAAHDTLPALFTTGVGPDAETLPALRQSVTAALRPLRRYRCAACGFEVQGYFWQCPGCHGWDTFPPRRLEDH